MITEDYVSFDTAKLLKEKGFNWIESPFYSEQDRDEWRQNNSYTIPNEEYNPELPFDSETLTMVAPHVSHQMAMKWLRDEHKIIPIILAAGDSYWFRIDKANEDNWKNTIYRENEKLFHTYEEACEASIKYCLENLI